MKKQNSNFSCVRRFVAVVAVMSMLFTLTSFPSTWSWYTGTITVPGANITIAHIEATALTSTLRHTYTPSPEIETDAEEPAEEAMPENEQAGETEQAENMTPTEIVTESEQSAQEPVAEAADSSVQNDEAPAPEPEAEPETAAEPTAEPEGEAPADPASEQESEPEMVPPTETETETAAEPEAEPEGEPDGEPMPEVETVTEIYTQVCIVVSGTAARGYLIVTIDDMEYLVSETVPGDVIYFTVFGDVAVDAQAYPGEYELPEPEAIDPEEELLHNIDEEYDLEAGGVFAPPELSECFSDYSIEHVEPETLETPEDIASFEPDYPALPELPVEELPVLPEQPAEDEQPAEESPETPDLPGDAALPDGAEGEEPEADGDEAPPPENTAGDETERSDDVSGPLAD